MKKEQKRKAPRWCRDGDGGAAKHADEVTLAQTDLPDLMKLRSAPPPRTAPVLRLTSRASVVVPPPAGPLPAAPLRQARAEPVAAPTREAETSPETKRLYAEFFPKFETDFEAKYAKKVKWERLRDAKRLEVTKKLKKDNKKRTEQAK